MKLCVNDDVAKIAAYMQRKVAAHNLRAVAHNLALLADLIWPCAEDCAAEDCSPKFDLFQVEWG